MAVELRPLGVKCNIRCQYCYQNPQRDAGNVAKTYSLPLMKQAVEREGGPFTLFGGEPLLLPLKDLEDLLYWGFMRWGQNSIQTNGTLIKDRHIELFQKYRVSIGISIDGPGELNQVREARDGKLSTTNLWTSKTEKNIRRLCRVGMPPSLIVTLHRNNATRDKLTRLVGWFRELDNLGITSARLHILEIDSDHARRELALSNDENITAFRQLAFLEEELSNLRFDVFADIRNQLLGKDEMSTCIWNACDPFETRAVRGVEGFGHTSNCGRVNKEGIDFIKTDIEGFERYLSLYYTPYEFGGCKGCKYFLMCKGQCPGTAIDGDWRNRTEQCKVWMTLFADMEKKLLDQGFHPISANPDLREQLEQKFLYHWTKGANTYMSEHLRKQG